MTKYKSSLLAALAGVAMTFAISSHAVVVNVGGVTWDTDHPLDFTSTSGNFAQTFTGSLATNDLAISAYGRIDFLNSANQATFCPGGCELTFVATGYLQNAGFSPNSNGEYEFTGGSVSIYVDNPGDFNLFDQSSAADGALWLSLSGHSLFATGFTDSPLTTLLATFTGAGATGVGLLDVTGGLAAANFDTNSRVDGADIEFQNSFTAGSNFQFGSGNFFGDSIAVPEPGSLLLLAAGLLGLGFSRRVKA